MPNWCMNRLEVIGPDAKEFYNYNKESGSGDFSFSTLVPEPEYKNDNQWYDWRLKNWGVKWDVANDDVRFTEISDSLVNIQFETPWDAPVEWLKSASKQFPHLKFILHSGEPGMNFHHEYSVCKGHAILSDSDSFSNKYDFWGFDEDFFSED